MELDLYNTLPEWNIKFGSGSYTPPVVIEKDVLLRIPSAREIVKTKKRLTSRNFSNLLRFYNPLLEREFDAFRFTFLK